MNLEDRLGQIGTPGVPRWELSGTTTYDIGRLSLTLQHRFIAAGINNPSQIGPDDPAYTITNPNSINNNRVPSRYYMNLSAKYDLLQRGSMKLQVFGSVSNLFDTDPPLAPGLIGYSEPAFFDMIGRTYHGGVRFTY